MQELFVDKTHFFKFLPTSDKPPLSLVLVVQYKLLRLSESFHPYREIPLRKGKYPMLRTNKKSHQPIKDVKISHSMVSLVFRKFLCDTY